MEPLFTSEVVTKYYDIDEQECKTQDEAIRASIITLVRRNSIDGEAHFFQTLAKYNLLDHMFQQCVNLGFLQPRSTEPAKSEVAQHIEHTHGNGGVTTVLSYARLQGVDTSEVIKALSILNEYQGHLANDSLSVGQLELLETYFREGRHHKNYGLATVSTLATQYHVKPLDIIHALNELYENDPEKREFQSNTIVSAHQVVLIDSYAKRNWER